MAEISVILPTFNRAHSLKRAMDSVFLQIGVDFELIVVDDGSTDETKELLNSYSNHKSILICWQKNKGVSSARNLGVAHSTGGYLAFLDSDDEWLPGKLQAQLDFTKSSGYAIHQSEEIWIRKGVRVNPPRHSIKVEGDIFLQSLHRCMITPSSVFMERKLFEGFGGFDESFPACEDYDLWLRVTAKHRVGLIGKQFLLRYGGHADQLSATVEALDGFRLRALDKLLSQGNLNPEQINSTLAVMKQKLDVYEIGCWKRGRENEGKWCREFRKKWIK